VQKESCYFWPEIPPQTQQCKWEHCHGGETNHQYATSQVGLAKHLPVDAIEHLSRNVGSQFCPWE